MKRLLLITTLLIGSVSIFGQDLIMYDEDKVENMSGKTIEVIGEPSDVDFGVVFYIQNTADKPLTFTYSRDLNSSNGVLEQICSNDLCLDVSPEDFFVFPVPTTVESGAYTLFKPQVRPEGEEVCLISKYYIQDSFENKLDSVTVVFKTSGTNCNLSVKNTEKVSFQLFPNPAKDVVTIKGGGFKQGGYITFVDALGKEVQRQQLNSTTQEVSIASLKRGVYFVNVYNNEGTKSSVQRLIKQ